MNLRKKEIEVRKSAILGITVKRYIDTVSPVSSRFIAEEYPLDVSSATVRNILAELEEEGFLTHPHTSAGRIPTQKGYRYYVDNLMHEIQLLEAEKRRIKGEIIKEREELELFLDRASQILSDVTQYTSIISVDHLGNKIFYSGTNYVVEYPDYQDIKKIKSILSALDEKERLLEVINQQLDKRIEIFIGQEMAVAEINSCSLVVSQYKTKSGATGRLAVLGPTRMKYERVISALEYLSHLMEEAG